MRSRARGYFFEHRQTTCPEESHSSFCSFFSLTEFLALATNRSSFIATGPDKAQSSLSHAKAPFSSWHGFSFKHFQCWLVVEFLSFHLEDIFYYSITIHKMGKSLDSPASFRPISLNSCVSKIFERIILSRLFFFLEYNSMLSPARPVSALNGLLLIKSVISLSSLRMGLTNVGRVLGLFLILSTSLKFSILPGIPPFLTIYFEIPSFLLCSLDSIFPF